MSSVTQKNPIRLFVCHVWQPDDDYLRVFEYLESVSNFFYRNTSTPEKRPAGEGVEGAGAARGGGRSGGGAPGWSGSGRLGGRA